MNFNALPPGYRQILKIQPEKDKLGMLFVSSLSCFLMLVMLFLGVYICGYEYIKKYILVDTPAEFYNAVYRLFLALLGLYVYVILRELLKALLSKIIYRDSVVKQCFKFMYFYTVSDSFFSKKCYCIINFIPALFLGALLLGMCFLVPEEYFVSVYFILTLNVSSISGDLYVWYFISRFDDDLLIKDKGLTVCFYSKR